MERGESHAVIGFLTALTKATYIYKNLEGAYYEKISDQFDDYIFPYLVSSCPISFAVDMNFPVESESIREISRESYISVMAEEKNISYEEAETLDAKQNLSITRGVDEQIRYATLEKTAGTISDGKSYSQKVTIAVYAKYVYNLEIKKAIELVEISAPYAYIPGVSIDNLTFDHGDYAITKNSSTQSSVVVIGSFVYTQPGISISVGGNILSVGTEVGGYRITTKAITFRANFFASDCH